MAIHQHRSLGKSRIKYYPYALIKCTRHAIEHIKTVDPSVIQAIIDYYPASAGIFAQCAMAHFPDINLDIVILLLDVCPELAPLLAQHIVDNFVTIDDQIIIKFIEKKPEMSELFVQRALETHHPKLLDIFADNDAYKDKLHQALAQRMTKNKQTFFAPFKNLGKRITQTVNHLRANLVKKYIDLCAHGYLDYESDKSLQQMTKQIIKQELIEQEKGRYTFVHAHAWFHHFYQEIYTDLWSIAQNKPLSHFKFVRYTWPFNQNTQLSEIIKQEQIIRKELMNRGVDYYYVNAGYQDRMLFMNYALFTNRYGSNSSYYIKMNGSENSASIHYKRFLEQLDLAHYFTQDELTYIKEQLTQLKTEHNQVSTYGGCLLLSFTPETLRACVYTAQPGGSKGSVNINGQEESDPQTILDALRADPTKIGSSDHTQFVCVLTYDCALKPNNGIDIYEFNAADQNKLAAWRTKKDELMRWINERVEQRRI